MYKLFISIRNAIIGFFYKNFLKPVLFKRDPEKVHDNFIKTGKFLGSNFLTRSIIGLMFNYHHKSLEQVVLGLHFKNPIGLGAGFDKNADLVKTLPKIGFGFSEHGSFTGEPCEGNAKPRLWRLPKSESIVVNYGLKNDGAEIIARRMQKQLKEGKFSIPLGINIAKTNCEATSDDEIGIADYAKAYKAFLAVGDYYTVNISCPNAFGGQPFTDGKRLDKLLTVLDNYYIEGKPVFLKISPDLTRDQIDDIIEVCDKHKVDGYICTNLTKPRDKSRIRDEKVPEIGGLSGKLVEHLANDLIKYIYKKTKGEKVIIGLGGVFTAEDAYKKIKLGATLIQLVTGMIFGGPQTISDINRGLVKLLRKDGYANVSEAVGVDNKL
ncbi:quinone-dependent dihydroorotate dehydrogenase [Candidatus Peregrinibacteria bacterium]|nr:quinone-dependent dihydroorotate dehydrogenase [Candidatus Peregrinibacteria bacterium]